MATENCPVCGGNDADVPCAHSTDPPHGCLRAARLRRKHFARLSPQQRFENLLQHGIIDWREDTCPNGANHTLGPRDYNEFREWSSGMARTHVQKQGPGCGLWLIWEKK